MKSTPSKALLLALTLGSTTNAFGADSITEAFKESKAIGNFNFRYESQNTESTVDLLSLRSRFGFTTGNYNNFSFTAEAEDVTYVAGVDGPLAFEPEVTEIDQAFIQYKTDAVTAKIGRQVIALDNQRFIGHVGWRQDRQTFDGVSFKLTPSKEFLFNFSYLTQRNRIFGEAADAESNDFLLNASYQTPIGKVVGYGYLLEDELRGESSDTVGIRLNGATKTNISFLYTAEYAFQDIGIEGPAGDLDSDFDTDYLLLEAGVKAPDFAGISGLTFKVGYELLSSDDNQASFTTPLATLHAFNGWADVFLGGGFNPVALPSGLEDGYISISGKYAGFSGLIVYHDFQSDETPAAGSGDYGSEFDFQITKPLGNGFNAGVKYASYSADSFGVDTDRFWTWLGYSF